MNLRSHTSSPPAREISVFRPMTFDLAYPRHQKEYYAASQDVIVPGASSLPMVREARPLMAEAYATPEDFVAVLRDAVYCGTNKVVMPRPCSVLTESMNGAATFSKVLAPVRASSFDDPSLIDGYATLFDSNFNGYYHQLVELIPRLLSLLRPPYTQIEEIKLLCPESLYPMTDYLLGRLTELRFRRIQVAEGQTVRIANLLFSPFKSRQYAGFLPPWYVQTIQRLAWPPRPSTRDRRVYISRRFSGKRYLRNQDELLSALSRRGFETFVLEDMTASEQIELFYDADVVVGTHGAGLANLIFSPHARVVELFPRDFVEPHYFFLCRSLGHEYRYWTNTRRSRWDPDFVAFKLRKHVRRARFRGRGASHHGRAINLPFSVDVSAVTSILSQMGID